MTRQLVYYHVSVLHPIGLPGEFHPAARWLFLLIRLIAWTFGVKIVIRLDILGQVNHFTRSKRPNAIYNHWLAMMVNTLVVTGESDLADHFSAFGSVCSRDFIFWENSFEWAFGDTCTTIDAGIGVDIKPWILFLGLSAHDAFNRADVHAARISQAQACNDMGHVWFLLKDSSWMRLICHRDSKMVK